MMKRLGKAAILMMAASLVAVLAISGSEAQIPDEFTNLKVLPGDISKPELIKTMKGFAIGLGVRCWFCHKGEGDDLSTFDFAADEKIHKEVARLMLRMVMTINEDFIAKLPEEGEDRAEEHEERVLCLTCHRGNHEPTLNGD